MILLRPYLRPVEHCIIDSGGNSFMEMVEAIENFYWINIWGFLLQCYWRLLGFFFGKVGSLRWMTHLVLSIVFYYFGEPWQCYHVQLVCRLHLETHYQLDFWLYLFISSVCIDCGCHLWAYCWVSVCRAIVWYAGLSGMSSVRIRMLVGSTFMLIILLPVIVLKKFDQCVWWFVAFVGQPQLLLLHVRFDITTVIVYFAICGLV